MKNPWASRPLYRGATNPDFPGESIKRKQNNLKRRFRIEKYTADFRKDRARLISD